MSSKLHYDSSEYRKHLWDKEYAVIKGLPSTSTDRPSSSLRNFFSDYNITKKDFALDLGCGNGRNSHFLIENGFQKVLSIDFSDKAIALAKNSYPSKSIDFKVHDLVKGFSLLIEPTSKFDLILDMMVLHSLTPIARKNTVKDIIRHLRSGGYYILFTLEKNSPAAKDLIAKNPGPEEGSYRFEANDETYTEKAFTKKELVDNFKTLKLTEYQAFTHTTKAFKKEYERVYIKAIFQKR